MTADRYRVTNAEDVREQFESLAAVARESGQLRLFVAASRWILEELARTPLEFGESWGQRPGSRLVLRRGFAGPLYVEYAIDTEHRVVFLRPFSLRR